MVERYREREDKYDVEPAWVMPTLAAAIPPGARVEERTVLLSSRYFDTADRDLLAHRVTLRLRSGDIDQGWQLKLPDGDSRLELRLPSDQSIDITATVPAELAGLVLGLRAGRPLGQVAVLDTERRLSQLLDADGSLLAELADDRVTASVPAGGPAGDGLSVQRWREVEVELGSAEPQLLDRIGDLLQATGARRSAAASKLGRALGEPAARSAPRPGSLGGLVLDYLDEQFQALFAGDLALRQGEQPIHRTRVATRRYRSVLRVFGKLFDPVRSRVLGGELAWYAGLLGEVRDRQVLRRALAEQVAALPPQAALGPIGASIEAELGAEQAVARAALSQALSSPRYLALLAELADWRRQPPTTAAADQPAGRVRSYLERAERVLDKRLRAARRAARQAPAGPEAWPRPDPARTAQANEALHRARKAAKRARYTGELAVPQLGKPARRLVTAATDLQDRLGSHQDAVVAADTLLRLGAAAGGRDGQNGFGYGVLYAQQLARAQPDPRQCRRR